MNYLLKLIFVFISLLFVSCGSDQAKQTVKVGNKYELELPKKLDKRTDLNPEASLQYGNAILEFYVAVIDEDHQEFAKYLEEEGNSEEMTVEELFELVSLDDYFSSCSENWIERSDMKVLPKEITETSVGGFPAYYVEKKHTVDGYEVFYNIAILKGKKAFYQIYVWTLAKQKEKRSQAMKDIIHSFKEL